MRRFWCVSVILALLCPRVAAAEQLGFVALTFEGYSPELAQVLEQQNGRATWLLEAPEQDLVSQLTRQGHEVGLRRSAPAGDRSRRLLAAQLMPMRQAFPKSSRATWLALPPQVDDPLRQVAEAMGLSFLGCTKDARQGLTSSLTDQIRSGDIVALGDISPEALGELLHVLGNRGLRAVTASRLALLHEIWLQPGRVYRRFPPPRENS